MSNHQVQEGTNTNTNSMHSNQPASPNQGRPSTYNVNRDSSQATSVHTDGNKRSGSFKTSSKELFNKDEDDRGGTGYDANIDPLIVKKNGGASGSMSPQMRIVDSKFSMSPGRHFRERTFSSLGKGSIRGSIFALCASAIGSGVLSLPYVLALCGYVAGVFFMTLGAIAAQWSLSLLAHLAVHHNLPNFSGITMAAGGKPLTKVLQWGILLFMFGSLISYQIIITSLMQYVAIQLWPDNTEFFKSYSFIIPQSIITCTCVLIPLSFKRDMDAFKYVSMISILSLVYTGAVLIIEVPEYWKANYPTADISPFYIDLNIFQGCSMTFFAFQCQIQLLPIYSELYQPNYRRVKKVINRALIVDLSFYLVIAIAGYASSFDKTNVIVLERDHLKGDTKTDYAILLAILAVIMSITVAFPVSFNPTRTQLSAILFGRETYSQKENLGMTLTFCYVTMGIAIVFPKVDKVLGIMGGLLAPTLDYLIPMYCYVKLSDRHWTHWKNLSAIIFFSILCFIGYTAVIVIVYEIFQDLQEMPKWKKF